jgi:hypothetical protein
LTPSLVMTSTGGLNRLGQDVGPQRALVGEDAAVDGVDVDCRIAAGELSDLAASPGVSGLP